MADLPFKVKEIDQFTWRGFTDEGKTRFGIKDIKFSLLTSLLFVEWEVRASTWQPGDQADIIISPISIDWQNMDVVSTIIQNSELIHQIVMDVAFIQTKEGLKSFNDLGATTVLA